jgi:hypothetical protein
MEVPAGKDAVLLLLWVLSLLRCCVDDDDALEEWNVPADDADD